MTEDTERAAERAPRRAKITAISEACHVSRGRAAELLKAAGMRKASDSTYLFDKAVETILSLIDPARSVGHQAGGDSSALPDGIAANVVSLSNAKARYEDMRAKNLAIDIAKKEGRLIEREKVFEAGRELFTHVRTGLAGVGAKVANDLPGAKNATEAQALVDDAIHDALIKLCDVGAYLIGAPP